MTLPPPRWKKLCMALVKQPKLRFLDKMAKQFAVIRSPFQVTYDPFTLASVYNGTPGSLLCHRKLGIQVLFESFFHRHLRRSTQSWLVLTCIINFARADFERPVAQPDIRFRYRTSGCATRRRLCIRAEHNHSLYCMYHTLV